jgi:hypothetical protein
MTDSKDRQMFQMIKSGFEAVANGLKIKTPDVNVSIDNDGLVNKLSETNKLLEQMVEKKEDIEITLKIE